MLDLRLVGYFVAVADELSFVRAARRLHVSPPTLSAGIQAFERHLDLHLFERTSRHVELTAAGERLLPAAKGLLAAADVLSDEADSLAGRLEFRVGTISGLGGALLIRAGDLLASRGLEVDLNMVVGEWQDPTAGLSSGVTDVAIVVGPTGADPLLVRRPLRDDVLLAVLPESHPQAADRVISIGDLDEMSWLWCRDGDPVAHAFWRLDWLRGGWPPRWRLSDSPQELLLEVRAGRGVCCVPAGFQEQFGFGGLALVPVAGAPTVSLDVARAATATSPVLIDLFDAVCESARTSGPSS